MVVDSQLLQARSQAQLKVNPRLPDIFLSAIQTRYTAAFPQIVQALLLPLSISVHWFLIKVTLNTKQVMVYDSISEYLSLGKMEKIINLIWRVFEPFYGKRGQIVYEDVEQQEGADICGLHVMMQTEEIIIGIPHDYSHRNVMYYRPTIMRALMITTTAGLRFLEKYDTGNAGLATAIAPYIVYNT